MPQCVLTIDAGERVGCLVLATATEHAATNSQSLLESLQRSEISNPPAFGARIAARILGDEALRAAWFEDLKTMSARIQAMRRALYDHLARNGAYALRYHGINADYVQHQAAGITSSGNRGCLGFWDCLLAQSRY